MKLLNKILLVLASICCVTQLSAQTNIRTKENGFVFSKGTDTATIPNWIRFPGFNGIGWDMGGVHFVTDLTIRSNTGNGAQIGSNKAVAFLNPIRGTGNCLWVGHAYYRKDGNFTIWSEGSQATLATVSSLNPVSFNWKSSSLDINSSSEEETHLGLIAQELEEVIPQLVSVDQNGYKSVDYYSIIPLLVKAVQDLNDIIQTQNERVNLIKGEMQDLLTK